MKIQSIRKSGASVLQVLDDHVVQVSLPGYTQTLVVDLANPEQVDSEAPGALQAVPGAKGDLYLRPAFSISQGIRPDQGVIKWPDSGGGSYGEVWRAWSTFQRLDERGPIAKSLRALRGEVHGGALSASAARFAAGDPVQGRAELDSLATGNSRATRSARKLLAPGDRKDRSQVVSVLQAAVVGILAEAC